MRSRIIVAVAGFVLVAGSYLWWVAQQAATSNPLISSERVAPLDNGEAPCSGYLELYAGPRPLWRRSSDQVNAMSEASALPESHQAAFNALNLFALTDAMDNAALLEVITCDGQVARFPLDELKQHSARFYVGANRRGAFKLIEIIDGADHTLMRDVGRIVLKPDGQRRLDAGPAE